MNLLVYLSYLVVYATSASWQPYKSTQEVDVFVRTEQCHDEVNGMHREYLLLKFVNKTDRDVQVSWQQENYYGNACSTCGKDEYKYSIKLTGQQIMEGTCADNSRELKVFVKHLDLKNDRTLSKFELGNFTVK